MAEPVPLTVLTGFLGAGKSTVLNHLLRQPAMQGTAVLVNEFGEVGLDHLLVQRLDETTVLLNAGCLCCTVRGDLVRALRDLTPKVKSGQVRRVVVETTGLADPAPILQTLMGDPFAATHYVLDGVVTVVDAVHALHQFATQDEAVKQAAIADRILLTKADLADPAPVLARLARLNPGTKVLPAPHGVVDAAAVLGAGFNPADKAADVQAWLGVEAHAPSHAHAHHHHGHDPNRHDGGIRAFSMTFDHRLHWQGVGTWLEMLITTQGEKLLRIKGILNLHGQDRPVVVNGVQHVFHPPSLLPAWPEGDPRTSRLVLIVRGLDPAVVEQGLRAFEDAAASAT